MPPKQATKDTPSKTNEDFNFLLSCLMQLETISWPEIAEINGIAGTTSLPAPKAAQRKFKRLVDASGRFTLDKGKVILKDEDATTTTSTKKTVNAAGEDNDQNEVDDGEGDDVPATPESPTPAPKSTGKKRGRPAGSTVKKSTKKPKIDEEE